MIPSDATLAAALKLDPAELFETVRGVADGIDPGAKQRIDEAIREAEEHTGLKLRGDVFNALGDTWRIFSSPSEGGSYYGLLAVASLRDAKKAAATSAKLASLVESALASLPAGGRPYYYMVPKLHTLEFAGKTIHSYDAGYYGMPLCLSWCVTDKELVVGLFPAGHQGLSLPAGRFQVVGPFAGRRRAVSRRAGGADEGGLPRLPSRVRQPVLGHLVLREVLSDANDDARRSAAGIEHRFRHAGAFAAGGAAAPGAGPERRAADRGRHRNCWAAVASRRRRRVGLAGRHRHAAVRPGPHAGFQRRTGVGQSSEADRAVDPQLRPSQPHFPAGLHYRRQRQAAVELARADPALPGENELYQQFHLNEPWDSPHNKKLIARMPAFFKSPGSKVANQGKTNYLTVRGDDTIFPGEEKITFAQVTDGLASTIMTVEASDAKAVVWTKPDDFAYDDKKPLAGLVGLRRDGFLAGFADGHVRRIKSSVKPDTLNALFTRDGGETVGKDDF